MQVYLNSASTTKPDNSVLNDFMWCAENCWHNPSDLSEESLAAKEIIENAQKQIAKSINAHPEEIIFTSGGSESNNWAIKGYVDYHDVNLIITTEIEHPSVYNTCLFCKELGIELIYVPVDCYGVIDLDYLEKIIDINIGRKILVSIMFANNEIGTIQPIKKISEIVHRYGSVLHVDAVQAYMHSPIDVQELGIDLMSTSFHKFGGFKGIGFLYIRNGIELTPLIHGGHQFKSKRAGTENVPMIYAMGNQVERLSKYLNESIKYIKDLYHYFIIKVYDKFNDCACLNGHPSERLYNNISFTFEGIDSHTLIALLESEGVYVSAGSACCAGVITPSRVLKSIGLSDNNAFSTIRISINDRITKKDIDYFVEKLTECIESMKIFF